MLEFSIITLSTFVTLLVSTTRYIATIFKKDISYYLPIFSIIYGVILSVCGYYFTDVEMGNNIIEAIFIGLSSGAGACGVNQVGKQLYKKELLESMNVLNETEALTDVADEEFANTVNPDDDDTDIDVP